MDDTFILDNQNEIRRRWPDIWSILAVENPDSLDASLTEGLCGTISINGIQLSSRHDRIAEAEVQASTIPDEPEIFLYGAGLGDLPRVLLQRHRLESLRVVIMNPALFLLTLHLQEHVDWLAHPKLELSLARNEHDIRKPFFALPPEIHLAENHANGVMQRLEAELSDDFVRKNFRQNDPELQARIQSNKHLLQQDPDVSELYGMHANATAYIIGSGPTLTGNLSTLKTSLKEDPDAVLICVDTAVKILNNISLRPDFVVSIDKKIGLEHFGEFSGEGSGLVYFPLVLTDVLEAWVGNRYAAYSASPIYLKTASEIPKGTLYSGGSVIHPAVDFAKKIGCSKIVLLGTDFGYPMDRTHAGWSDGELGPSMNTATSWTLNGKAERIKSDPNFNSYRCELERYIAAHPAIDFYNTSREGASISGCEFHPVFCQ